MTNMNGIGSGYIQGGNAIDKAATAKTAQPKLSENATNPMASQDGASLSGTGSLMAAAAANTDDVRADKVESLRAAINNGTYNVPAGDVADKILKNMLE